MATLFCDGFDHYDTAYLLAKWDNAENISNIDITSPGRNTSETYNQYLNLTYNSSLYKTLPNSQTLIVGFAFNPSTLPTPGNSITLCAFYDQNTQQVSVLLEPSGQLQVQTTSSNGTVTILGATPSGSVRAGTYTYVEIYITFGAGTSGLVGMLINGQAALDVPGVNTSMSGNSYANLFQLYGPGYSGISSLSFDDLYICDGTGSVNNTFLGDVRMTALLPNGNGSVSYWSEYGGTTGQNWTAIDEVPPDGDDSYVYASEDDIADAYTFASIGTVSAIVTVQLVSLARKTDSASRLYAMAFGDGDTNIFGSAISPSNSYLYYFTVFDQNPITTNNWAPTDFDGAQIALGTLD